MNATANMNGADGRNQEKISVRGLNFFYGQSLALKSIDLPLLRQRAQTLQVPGRQLL